MDRDHDEFVYPDDEPQQTQRAHDCEHVLNELMDWMFPRKTTPKAVMIRAYALAWFIRRDWLAKHPSQQQIADKLNISKQSFGKYVNQFSKRFGFVRQGMRNDVVRKKLSNHAKKNSIHLARARRLAVEKRERGKVRQGRGDSR